MNSDSARLVLESISYAYSAGQWHLRDLHLALEAGRICGIIGPNGAGKSTLLKIAAGILPCPSGKITLAGRDMQRYSRREMAAILGYLPQLVGSTFDLVTEQVVAMGRDPHLSGAGFLQDRDIRIIEQCLRQTETLAYRRRRLSELSGGERQRVMLASVLAQQPRVLLLDEPTTGLDLHHQVTFFQLLKELAGQGIAIAVVTHDLNLAGQFCDKLLLLKDGQLVKEGSIEQVIEQQILRKCYGPEVFVSQHPLTGDPIVLPLADIKAAEAGNPLSETTVPGSPSS